MNCNLWPLLHPIDGFPISDGTLPLLNLSEPSKLPKPLICPRFWLRHCRIGGWKHHSRFKSSSIPKPKCCRRL